MMKPSNILIPIAAIFLAACAQAGDEEVAFINGKIYTLNEQQPLAEAMAVSAGRITAAADSGLWHNVGHSTFVALEDMLLAREIGASFEMTLMQTITQNDIEGLWNLLSMEQRYDDGRVTYPFGKKVEGRIYYGADNSMFCAIQKRGRAPFSTGKQWTADDTEKARAYNDYLTYCGRYELNGDTATHHIEISLYPDWIGKRQERKLRLVGAELHITARLEENTPEARTSLLIWERG